MSWGTRKRTWATGPWMVTLLCVGALGLAAQPARALPAAPTHYGVAARTPVGMTLTGLLTVDGAAAPAGAEVAVYTPGNVLCGASGVDAANGGAFVLHVYGDDPTTTPALEGMAAGQALRFEVWVPSPAPGRTVAQASLRFLPAPFGAAPPAYPPLFADRAAYSLNVSENRAPVANAGSLSTQEDTAAGGTLAATDADGNPLTYSIVANGTKGTAVVTNAATGAYTYTPSPNANGADSFTFRANDGKADSNTATVSVNIGAVNDAPVANAGSFTTQEDTVLNATLSASDVEGSALTFSLVAGGAGSVSITNTATGAFRYTPLPDFAGTDSFTFRVNDGALNSNTATATITVTPVNDAPVLAAIGPKSVDEGATLGFTVLASDADGNPLTYSASGLPAGATFSPGSRTFLWTPTFDQAGTHTVTFSVADNGTPPFSDSESVTITVANVNRAPVLAAVGNKSVAEGQTLQFAVSASDADGNAVALTAAPLPAGATFADAGNRTGTFSWPTATNQAGVYTVTFTATDNGSPALSDAETITISVGDVNQPPVLTAVGPKAATEMQALTFTLTATDVDGGALTFGTLAALPEGATLDPATGAFAWTPAYGQEGAYDVTFTVTDAGTPGLSDQETVTITVAAAVVTVGIPLQAGWNLVSFPVALCSYAGSAPAVALPAGVSCTPVASSIGEVFAGIAAQLELVRSFDVAGQHTYDPALPDYVNDLTYVAAGYGYWIKMKQAATWNVTGRRLPPAAAMTLPAGWTLAGYWGPDVRHTGTQPTVAFPAGTTFTPVGAISQVFQSLSPAPQAVWSTDAGGDHADPVVSGRTPLTYVGPGYGYWIKLGSSATLSYDLP